MTLRIITGSLKGRVLRAPQRTDLRPTMDAVRETVFQWLQPWLPKARVLDLFAGSGILGFEALSRGAQHVTWVDRSSLRHVASHAQKWDITPSSYHIQTLCIGRDQWPAGMWDIVLIDPPFNQPDLYSLSMRHLLDHRALSKQGVVYMETPHHVDILTALSPYMHDRSDPTQRSISPDHYKEPNSALIQSLRTIDLKWRIHRIKRFGKVWMILWV